MAAAFCHTCCVCFVEGEVQWHSGSVFKSLLLHTAAGQLAICCSNRLFARTPALILCCFGIRTTEALVRWTTSPWCMLSVKHEGAWEICFLACDALWNLTNQQLLMLYKRFVEEQYIFAKANMVALTMFLFSIIFVHCHKALFRVWYWNAGTGTRLSFGCSVFLLCCFFVRLCRITAANRYALQNLLHSHPILPLCTLSFK